MCNLCNKFDRLNCSMNSLFLTAARKVTKGLEIPFEIHFIHILGNVPQCLVPLDS